MLKAIRVSIAPLQKLPVLYSPNRLKLAMSRRLAVLTATSSIPLHGEKYGEEMRWCTPHFLRKASVALEENCGPQSG